MGLSSKDECVFLTFAHLNCMDLICWQWILITFKLLLIDIGVEAVNFK